MVNDYCLLGVAGCPCAAAGYAGSIAGHTPIDRGRQPEVFALTLALTLDTSMTV